MPSTYAVKYLLMGLESAPDVQAALCTRDTNWNARPPGEGRFTVRESLAHLADWEDVWSQRVRRTVEEDSPQLPDADEDQMAIDHDYRSADPEESLRTYKQSRAELVRYIRALPDSAWSRKCHREGVGEMTLFDLAVNILGHDGYHFQHTLESLKART